MPCDICTNSSDQRKKYYMSNNSRFYISMYHYTRNLQHSRYPGIKGMDVGQVGLWVDYC